MKLGILMSLCWVKDKVYRKKWVCFNMSNFWGCVDYYGCLWWIFLVLVMVEESELLFIVFYWLFLNVDCVLMKIDCIVWDMCVGIVEYNINRCNYYVKRYGEKLIESFL